MKKCLCMRLSLLFLYTAMCPVVFAQTFQITNRAPSSGTLNLDETLSVTFTVQGTSVPTRVVPVLRVSNPSLASDVSTTWLGTSPIVGWNGSPRDIAFDIHLFNEPARCGENITFQLFFYTTATGSLIQASSQSSSFLNIPTTSDNLVRLTNRISSVADTFPQPIPGGVATWSVLTETFNPDLLTDPQNRIYAYFDYFLGGFNFSNITGGQAGIFTFFLYQINPSDCAISFTADVFAPPHQGQSLWVNGAIVDETPEPDVNVISSAFGGGGVTIFDVGQGINVFDITDLTLSVPSCSGATLRDSLFNGVASFDLVTNFVGNSSQVLRDVRIYFGRESSCTANADRFGPAPSFNQFHINNFTLASNGVVTADLEVPSGGSGWKTSPGSTVLKPQFMLSWFLRRGNEMYSLGAETQNLSLSTTAPIAIDNPDEFFLEARIRETASGNRVSTTNATYNHALTYQLPVNVQFQNAEQNFSTGGSDPDEFFDPGEIIRFTYQVTDPNDGALNASMLDTGYVVDLNGNNQVDGSDRFVSINQALADEVNIRLLPVETIVNRATNAEFGLPFELLQAPDRDKVWFWAEFTNSRNVSGVQVDSSYRRYFSLRDLFSLPFGLNGEDTELFSNYNFRTDPHQQEGWQVVNETLGPGLGWNYLGSGNQAWIGNGGTLTSQAQDLNSLISPRLPIGTDSAIAFNHLPQFTFNQSGGILEYRIHTGASATPWSNFISETCSGCGIYDAIPFPDNFDSYLAGQQVWMSTALTSELEGFDIPNSFIQQFTIGVDEIQFRFVFQDPSLNPQLPDSDGPTHWEVYEFSYSSFLLLEDNVFGLDTDTLSLDACEDTLRLVLANPPVSVNAMTFEWFQSLSNLHNDISAGQVVGASGLNIPFTQPTIGTYNYYVRISTGVTERIVPVVVVKNMTCATCLTLGQALSSVYSDFGNGLWPNPKSILTCIEVLNQVCAPQ